MSQGYSDDQNCFAWVIGKNASKTTFKQDSKFYDDFLREMELPSTC